jgi:hypothetical protein
VHSVNCRYSIRAVISHIINEFSRLKVSRTARLDPVISTSRARFTEHGSLTGYCTYQRNDKGLEDHRSTWLCSHVPECQTWQKSSDTSINALQGSLFLYLPAASHALCSVFQIWKRRIVGDSNMGQSNLIAPYPWHRMELPLSPPHYFFGMLNISCSFLEISPVHAMQLDAINGGSASRLTYEHRPQAHSPHTELTKSWTLRPGSLTDCRSTRPTIYHIFHWRKLCSRLVRWASPLRFSSILDSGLQTRCADMADGTPELGVTKQNFRLPWFQPFHRVWVGSKRIMILQLLSCKRLYVSYPST